MRALKSASLLCFLFTFSAYALAPAPVIEVCGLYQVEDFGDTIVYSLIDTLSIPARTLTYRIGNPEAETVVQMVNLRCYCVSGTIKPDPEFRDSSFKLIHIEKVSSGPNLGCNP